jgi:hypothetical protein
MLAGSLVLFKDLTLRQRGLLSSTRHEGVKPFTMAQIGDHLRDAVKLLEK